MRESDFFMTESKNSISSTVHFLNECLNSSTSVMTLFESELLEFFKFRKFVILLSIVCDINLDKSVNCSKINSFDETSELLILCSVMSISLVTILNDNTRNMPSEKLSFFKNDKNLFSWKLTKKLRICFRILWNSEMSDEKMWCSSKIFW